jgi:hypothetical protein
MNFKKTNAVLGLITIFLMTAHAVYQMFAYITFYYNPLVSKLTGFVLLGVVVLHVILSMLIVFTKTDSVTVTYKRRNIRTVIQRVSAMMMVILLPVHVFEFELLKRNAGSAVKYLIELTMIFFYAVLMMHISMSFSNALITLGLLEDMKKKKIIDTVVLIISIAIFTAASVITLSVQLKMF